MQLHTELHALYLASRQILERVEDASARIEQLSAESAAEQDRLASLMSLIPGVQHRLTEILTNQGINLPGVEASDDFSALVGALGDELRTRDELASPEKVEAVLKDIFGRGPSFKGQQRVGSLRDALDEAMASLNDTEQDVIRLRFGLSAHEGLTLEPGQVLQQHFIAKLLGISQQTVSRVLSKAIRRLRHPARSDPLRRFANELDFAAPLHGEQAVLAEVFYYNDP